MSAGARPVLALLVLGLFAAALPVQLPGVLGASEEQCLTLADNALPSQPDSLVLLERCTTLYPDDAELAGDVAAAYEAAGDPARAEAAYRRALSIDPRYAELRLRLGHLLLRRGAAADAAREAQAALQVQPNRRALVDLLRLANDEIAEAGE